MANSDGKSNNEQNSQNSENSSRNSEKSGQYRQSNTPFPQPIRTPPPSSQYNIPENPPAQPDQRHSYPHNPYAYNLPYQYVVYIPQAPSRRMYTSGRKNCEEHHESPSQPPDSPPDYSGFSDVEIRKAFVRKVYMILMLQLIFTFGVIALFIFEPHIREYVRENRFMYYISLAIFLGVYIGLACSGDLRRKFPTNIILLSVFTLAASYMFATISSHFNNDAIFMAIGISAVVCFTVTLFSFNTKFDFTSCGGLLCILLLILIIFGIIAIFMHSKVMTMIYAGLGAIVFTMYLAYDTQMLMGGKTIEIHPEEHILAAIQIYLDILYVYIYILMLIGIGNN